MRFELGLFARIERFDLVGAQTMHRARLGIERDGMQTLPARFARSADYEAGCVGAQSPSFQRDMEQRDENWRSTLPNGADLDHGQLDRAGDNMALLWPDPFNRANRLTLRKRGCVGLSALSAGQLCRDGQVAQCFVRPVGDGHPESKSEHHHASCGAFN